MCTNWKRFTLKAIMLASLSLFLYGCSGSDDSFTPPPSPPPNLKATATSRSVTLTWGAATDNVGGTGVYAYYVYRNGVFISATSALTYTDNAVIPATVYTYMVKARDAVGNVSAGSTVDVTTLPSLTYTISGKITNSGSGLSSVVVAISGASSDVVVTDANGNYTFIGIRAGSYTITPTLAGFAFTPVSRPVVVAAASVTGMDFTVVSLTPGTVTGVVTNPDGSVTTTTKYPDGSVTTTTKYPNATVTTTTTYPNGTVTTSTTYPDGTVTTSITYPDGTVTTSTTYPSGTVTTSTTYPDGTVTAATTYPAGSVTTTTTNPDGSVTTTTTYPNGTVTISTTNPNGTVTTSTTNPNGTVTTSTTNPNGTVTTSTTNPNGTVSGGTTSPTGTVTTNTTEYNVIVYGRVVNASGAGLPGVSITVTDGPATTTTTTSFYGTYSFKGVAGKTYTITPSLSGYSFSALDPVPVSDNAANIPVPDITATAI